MRRRRIFSPGAYVAVPLALALALAGCSSPDGGAEVASVSGTASPSAGTDSEAAGLSGQEKALKYAQCMRDHGVPMEDPQIDGGKIEVKIDGGRAPGDKSKFDAAQEACKEYTPGGGPNGGNPDPQAQENMRKMAQCMRDSGVPNFPDPDPQGGIRIDRGVGEDPDFPAAQQKCEAQYGPKKQ
jgi:hypothetical protein